MHFRNTIFFILIIIFGYSFAENDLLKRQDVDKIMNQIMQQHVDKKEMTNKIIKKAIVIYIDQFDPERIYLLDGETAHFLTLSDDQAGQILAEYRKGNYEAFDKLNGLIEKGVARARAIRSSLGSDPSIFSERKKDFNNNVQKPFASNETELKGRIRDQFLRFIEAERRRYGQAQVLRNESQLLGFYEKEVRSHEEAYLGTDEKGNRLPAEAVENLFVLHVLKALASSLDAHTSFLNAAEAYDMRVHLEKEYQGVGITMQERPSGVYVTAILPGSPADKSGQVKVNDQVLEIDGKAITGEAFGTVMDRLRGKTGSAVTLLLDRKGKGKFELKLTRAEMTMDDDRVDVSYESFGNGIIGKITLHSFYQSDKGISSEKDVREAIKKLQGIGNLRGLVLDLRENSGGFLNQAVKVAGLFISNGIIVISKYSNGDEKFYRDMDSSRLYDGPLIVLTSKATASAAEIVAQALQDYGVALVVGDEHTYGKGTIQSQTITDNKGGNFFKVTVGKYYTVSGKTPQITGVKSNIVVPSQFNREQIGEEFLDVQIKPDTITSAYNDPLKDIDSNLKPWYLRYYTPNIQHRKEVWDDMVPVLKKNSEYRIAHNKNYQMFLKQLKGETYVDPDADDEADLSESVRNKKNFGADDLQMGEAVNIVKDMVYLQTHERHRPAESVAASEKEK